MIIPAPNCSGSSGEDKTPGTAFCSRAHENEFAFQKKNRTGIDKKDLNGPGLVQSHPAEQRGFSEDPKLLICLSRG